MISYVMRSKRQRYPRLYRLYNISNTLKRAIHTGGFFICEHFEPQLQYIVMIYINKGEVNSIVLTLNEVSSLSSPYYLFVFQNEMNPTSDPILFTTTDESPYPERFNLFYLDEPVDVTLMKGQYSYSVYESTTPPTEIDDTTGIVIEEGRMVVSGASTSSIYD